MESLCMAGNLPLDMESLCMAGNLPLDMESLCMAGNWWLPVVSVICSVHTALLLLITFLNKSWVLFLISGLDFWMKKTFENNSSKDVLIMFRLYKHFYR